MLALYAAAVVALVLGVGGEWSGWGPLGASLAIALAAGFVTPRAAGILTALAMLGGTALVTVLYYASDPLSPVNYFLMLWVYGTFVGLGAVLGIGWRKSHGDATFG